MGDARAKHVPRKVNVRPTPVEGVAITCSRCVEQGTKGFMYGDDFYCNTCFPLTGLAAQEQKTGTGVASTKTCADCGLQALHGQWWKASFYCDPCWRAWQGESSCGNESATDVGTDYTDIETDATIIDSNCVSASDSEWD